MKQVLLLAFAAVSVARLGVAGTCGGGSLASYVALGPGGCMIGSDTLNNFKILNGINGGTAIAPGSVTITPSGSTFAPGLTIATNQSASNGTPLEIIFSYDILGPMFTSISTVLSGTSETVDGGVTGLINFCQGGNFGPDGVSGCGFTSGSLLTLDGGIQPTDMAKFPGIGFLNVTNDLTIDPGTAGTAAGGMLTNTFTAAPEPMSMALTGLGLALAGLTKVRSLRAKQENKRSTI